MVYFRRVDDAASMFDRKPTCGWTDEGTTGASRIAPNDVPTPLRLAVRVAANHPLFTKGSVLFASAGIAGVASVRHAEMGLCFRRKPISLDEPA